MPENLNSSWSIESELCKVAVSQNISHALYLLGLLSDPSIPFHIDTYEGKWVRGGAETYIYHFSVTEKGRKPIKALIKACIAFTPEGNLENLLQNLIKRRELLKANGVIIPELYGWGQGVIIEEYIPFTVREVLTKSKESLDEILNHLVIYSASISKLGFAPINPFSDLRSHGSDVVAIDFGEDLGPPGIMNERHPEMFKMLCDYLESAGVTVTSEVLIDLRETFENYGGIIA